jgi:hypothetical protein
MNPIINKIKELEDKEQTKNEGKPDKEEKKNKNKKNFGQTQPVDQSNIQL